MIYLAKLRGFTECQLQVVIAQMFLDFFSSSSFAVMNSGIVNVANKCCVFVTVIHTDILQMVSTWMFQES